MNKLFFIAVAFLAFGCKQKSETKKPGTEPATSVVDPHSFAEPRMAFVKHLELDLKVDFEKKTLTGKASWQISVPGDTKKIIFDTRQLTIQKVTLGKEEAPAEFTLGKEVEVLGSPLSIKIDHQTVQVNIYYSTANNAAALQWLVPQQTAGKQRPFLFTQSEAILARTWIPCQDGPGVRFTYHAKVTVPSDMLALMSAVNPQRKNETGIYEFEQLHPIPSYLMALTVGDIEFRPVDSITGVYAEPSVVDKAAWEFADMGKMVSAAEKLYGPYQWGRYDLMVLPPSFPFGGMENPMLTFATPTVIAGDRSLVSLVAHELAHSWSGNLVTNATWSDFWMNEGFTTYIERRLVEAVYGVDEREMQEVLGLQDLREEMSGMKKDDPDTRLLIDLNGRDPDLGVSTIAYEKGYLFLKHIELIAGRARFDSFLNKYFSEHQFQSITTLQFLDYLEKNLPGYSAVADRINADQWVKSPGLPADMPSIRSSKYETIDSLIRNWQKTNSIDGLSTKIVSSNERIYFLRNLPVSLSALQLSALDKAFGLTHSGNAEIQSAWYLHVIRNQYKVAYPSVEKFLISVGRRKFLAPLYTEMIKTPEGKEWAKKIYIKARPNYHSVSYKTIDELLK